MLTTGSASSPTWSGLTPGDPASGPEKLYNSQPKIGYPRRSRLLDARHRRTTYRQRQRGYSLNTTATCHLRPGSNLLRIVLTPQKTATRTTTLATERDRLPSAIRSRRFFDAEADNAATTGGIGGAVIVHISAHGFDDQGR